MVLFDIDKIIEKITLKHLHGEHDQKRHGNRGASNVPYYRTPGAKNKPKGINLPAILEKRPRGRPRKDISSVSASDTGKAKTANEAMKKVIAISEKYATELTRLDREITTERMAHERVLGSSELAMYARYQQKLYDATREDFKKIDAKFEEKMSELRKIKPDLIRRDAKGYIEYTPKEVIKDWDNKYNAMKREWTKARDKVVEEIKAKNPEISNLSKQIDGFEGHRNRHNQLLAEKNGLIEKRNQETLKILSVNDPNKVTSSISVRLPDKKKAAEDGMKIFNQLVSGTVARGSVTVKGTGSGRASYGVKMSFTTGSSSGVFVHEMGHWLEATNGNVYSKAREFLRKRTAGEKLMSMNTAVLYKRMEDPGFNSGKYRGGEYTRKDKFIHPYMGKEYPYATEIVSMGLEMFYGDAGKLASQDPEYFTFIFDLVRA